MANTTNILLNIPAHGSFVDTWDVPVNADFSALDGFLGGVQTINAAGASPITLTAPAGSVTPAGGPTQAENAVLRFSGALTGNVQVTLPLPGYMIIENLTTGSFVLSFRAVGAGEVIGIEQGSVQHIYNDGTNVRFVNLPQVGSYLDLCDATVPAWITACTKPPYLLCDGSVFSSVTYPYLWAKLGTTTLPDSRGRAPYYLNYGTGRLTSAGAGIDGNTRFAAGGSNGLQLTSAYIPTLTSANAAQSIIVDVPGSGANRLPYSSNGDLLAFSAAGSGAFVSIYSAANNWAFTSSLSRTQPISVSYVNASPSVIPVTAQGFVSGIRMIRAA